MASKTAQTQSCIQRKLSSPLRGVNHHWHQLTNIITPKTSLLLSVEGSNMQSCVDAIKLCVCVFLPGDSSLSGELMLGLRVMLWNLGVILWGWGLVNSCLGVWPNSRICVSMAILWSGSSLLPREKGQSVTLVMLNMFQNYLWLSLIPIVVNASFVGQWVKHWKETMRFIRSFCPVFGGFDVANSCWFFYHCERRQLHCLSV